MSLPPPPPVAVPGSKNSRGTWSLVPGILGFILCPAVASAGAIITGTQARQAFRRGEATNGSTALTGLILASAGLAFWLLAWISGAFDAVFGS